jgi:hypothetical protein
VASFFFRLHQGGHLGFRDVSQLGGVGASANRVPPLALGLGSGAGW